MSIKLDITPIAKPRQTKADVWKKRPAVMRYRAFADELRLKLDRDFDFNFAGVTFVMPMPKSWSNKKAKEMDGAYHEQKPDLDNMLKALLDAHMGDDAGVHTLSYLQKVWGRSGAIVIVPHADIPWRYE